MSHRHPDIKVRRLYYIWCDMRRRCADTKHRQFKDYGGRGVAVCDRWLNFAAFMDDMGLRPDGMSLDRIDNEKGYSPDNCRWSTRKEQNSNRRNCIHVMHGNDRVTLKEYCRREGLRYRAIRKRLERGWDEREALTLPLGSRVFDPHGRRIA